MEMAPLGGGISRCRPRFFLMVQRDNVGSCTAPSGVAPCFCYQQTVLCAAEDDDGFLPLSCGVRCTISFTGHYGIPLAWRYVCRHNIAYQEESNVYPEPVTFRLMADNVAPPFTSGRGGQDRVTGDSAALIAETRWQAMVAQMRYAVNRYDFKKEGIYYSCITH